MPPNSTFARLTYTPRSFDRAGHKRRDDTWLVAMREADEARFVLFTGLKPLVTHGDARGARYFARHELPALDLTAAVFMGVAEAGQPVFSLQIDAPDGLDAEAEEVRALTATVPAEEAALLAYGRGLWHWHHTHRFCGTCGGPTAAQHGGHIRRCLNCGREHYPRTDPAVIVLVTHEARCLLGRSTRLPEGMYSTLAGFVEPGESLEDTVRREIMEEAGLRVGRIRYRASQPWPFPASLMLGFRAETDDPRLRFEDDELEDAAWFTRDQLQDAARRRVKLPNRDSIARALIEEWLVEA